MKSALAADQKISPWQTGFDLSVVFTTVQNTLLSLRRADQLTRGLASRIRLLVPESADEAIVTVSPAMLADFAARYFLTMLPHATDLQIKIVRFPSASRDLWETLPPGSIIVLAGITHRFWPSAEQRFARDLLEAGHEVILLPVKHR